MYNYIRDNQLIMFIITTIYYTVKLTKFVIDCNLYRFKCEIMSAIKYFYEYSSLIKYHISTMYIYIKS